MGIFDFFKRKKQSTDIEISSETISLSNLEEWLQNKNSELVDKKSKVLTQTKDRISQLVQELEQGIEILQQIDLNAKPKVEERIKLIVKGNLENYIKYLTKLIESLNDLKPDLNTLSEKTNEIFSDFEQKSNLSFQKATFLIGEELEKTKTSIANFFRDLRKILDENKNLINLSKTIYLTETELKEIDSIDSLKKETEKDIEKIEQKTDNLKDKIQTEKKDIEKIKKSKEYEDEIKAKQIIQNDKQELEKELQKLKETINFKELANIFHSNKKEMELIKEHKEKFQKSFDKDDGKQITSILEDAKLITKDFSTKIEKIIKIKQKVEDSEKNLKQTETKNINNKEQEIVKLKQEIEGFNYENTREKNKSEKFNKNKQEIINQIKQELNKIDIGMEA